MTHARLNQEQIPLGRIDSAQPLAFDARHSHIDSVAGARTLGEPAPCYVFVGTTPISEARIAHEMQHHRSADPQQSRADAARALVVRELLRLEAERLKIVEDAVQTGEETRDETRIRILLEREIATPEPSPEACRRYYENNRARLHHPDCLRMHHILLAAAADDGAARLDARELGERLIAQLRVDPERFTDFAQRYSACPSRDHGGDLGWIERGDATPEFERQVFMLPCGLAGLTIESRYGHHVVCVDEIRRGAPLTFKEAERKIAAYLETQAKQNAIHDYLKVLAERHGVRGLDEAEAAAESRADRIREAPSAAIRRP